jgi:SAM-dependent methyltransferase
MTWDHKQSVKQVVKHVGHHLGARDLRNKVRQLRGYVTEHLEKPSTAERFSIIYRLGLWVQCEGQRSSSGVGSEVAATSRLREALPSLLDRLGCRKLLDVGCGDWNWLRSICLPCDYLGVDIVPELIEANREYERPGIAFAIADAIVDPLPKADVVLCRDMLFHLSFRDGLAVLANIRQAADWLLATTDAAIWFNSNIRTGDYRRINLRYSPYRLPPPREIIPDDAVSPGRVLGLWARADLPA